LDERADKEKGKYGEDGRPTEFGEPLEQHEDSADYCEQRRERCKAPASELDEGRLNGGGADWIGAKGCSNPRAFQNLPYLLRCLALSKEDGLANVIRLIRNQDGVRPEEAEAEDIEPEKSKNGTALGTVGPPEWRCEAVGRSCHNEGNLLCAKGDDQSLSQRRGNRCSRPCWDCSGSPRGREAQVPHPLHFQATAGHGVEDEPGRKREER